LCPVPTLELVRKSQAPIFRVPILQFCINEQYIKKLSLSSDLGLFSRDRGTEAEGAAALQLPLIQQEEFVVVVD
jgi:hypothetical protein